MHILGASGHAKVVIDILALNQQEVSGIWDDNTELKEFLNYKVRGNIASLRCGVDETCIIAIGNNEIRRNIALMVNLPFSNVIHPMSYISRSAEVGMGVTVMAQATVNPFSKIGNHVIINTGSSVDHDCIYR